MTNIPDRSRTSILPPQWKVSTPSSLLHAPVAKGRSARDYEFQVLTIPKGTSIGQTREALTDEAEYGRWELARTQKFIGGGKKVWLRRRIMRVTAP